MKSLAVVIPTFNRSNKIKKTLESIASSNKPKDISISVYLVDNNSTPEHSKTYNLIVDDYKKLFSIEYLFEIKQGRSPALNRGVAESNEDVVAFIDDDESIDTEWFQVILKHFINKEIDYLGGACKPDWETNPPAWLPAHIGKYKGILGWIEQADQCIPFNNFDGELCGGNCAIRRSIFAQVGCFNVNLGRSAKNLMGGEDGEFHRRLKSHKKYGIYDPDLIIYHQIPKTRMTFTYHLRWAFWSGVSNGIRLRIAPLTAERVPHLIGVPRYWGKKAVVGIRDFVTSVISLDTLKSPKGICGAMDVSYLAGLLYGRYFIRTDSPED